jgi:hypothetical protein
MAVFIRKIQQVVVAYLPPSVMYGLPRPAGQPFESSYSIKVEGALSMPLALPRSPFAEGIAFRCDVGLGWAGAIVL